jgi:hypothetical protein
MFGSRRTWEYTSTCSARCPAPDVAILVDRGLVGPAQITTQNVSLSVEAFAYATRMKTIGSLAKVSVFVVGRMPPAQSLVERPDELGQEGSLARSYRYHGSKPIWGQN